MNEFDLIKKYFAPLAANFPGSLDLTDDAAIIDVPAGKQLVITKDAICEGVHFVGNEEPALIAKKLLRVNLSDLAAKGATPLCYFMAGMLPAPPTEDWIASFTRGLAEDQKEFGIHLAGGDTSSTKANMAFTITALGTIPAGQMLRRSGANVGDDIYVSGTLGDSALGLLALHHADILPNKTKPIFLIQRYLVPEPRIALGQKLRGIASSCMDISDGLMQDLGHICKTSGVGAEIERALLPLSEDAAALIKKDIDLWSAPLTGGDDYELLFTAPKEKAEMIAALPTAVTKIGSITDGDGVIVLNEKRKPITLSQKGFTHF